MFTRLARLSTPVLFACLFAVWQPALVWAASAEKGAAANTLEQVRARLPEDEIIYFVLPDRFENGDRSNDKGGLAGDRLTTGYDPTHVAFYHGGDFKGLQSRLDYIQG